MVVHILFTFSLPPSCECVCVYIYSSPTHFKASSFWFLIVRFSSFLFACHRSSINSSSIPYTQPGLSPKKKKKRMVVPKPSPVSNEKIRATQLPIINLMDERSEVSNLIVKACENFGFFKIINHGFPEDVIARMEEQSYQFFAKSSTEKERAGPSNPYGYGCKNIGCNGDVGEVEYLLLDANPLSVSHATQTISISNDPIKFRYYWLNYSIHYNYCFLIIFFQCMCVQHLHVLAYYVT